VLWWRPANKNVQNQTHTITLSLEPVPVVQSEIHKVVTMSRTHLTSLPGVAVEIGPHKLRSFPSKPCSTMLIWAPEEIPAIVLMVADVYDRYNSAHSFHQVHVVRIVGSKPSRSVHRPNAIVIVAPFPQIWKSLG
jgi:hypothetical protein